MNQVMTNEPQFDIENPVNDSARISRIVAALRGIEALYGLSEEEYHWFAHHGNERKASDGAIVFRQDEPAHHLIVVLGGEIYVHRRNTGAVTLSVGRTGRLTGKLPYSRMTSWRGEGSTSGDYWALEIHEELFPELLQAVPSMNQRCVSILLDRTRDFTRADQQAEKLAALGKLAANLSHELNNPASAAQRAALSLSSHIGKADELYRLGRLMRSDEELATYIDWTKRALAAVALSGQPATANPLSESDREDEFIDWLNAHQVPSAWSLASVFAEVNFPLALLDELVSLINSNALCPAVTSFAASLDERSMLNTIAGSSQRIFRIITAIKDYSYMDQAPIQEVDLVRSLETSLELLNPRLESIEITRDYDPTVPAVTAYGGELSQVWTALIENAADAMNGRGVLKITTGLRGQMAFVEIWDNGPGIDADLASHIFEPFFTTKPLGRGLGLGLDTVQRIVSKHFGSVTLQSAPHATCFEVRLPLNRPQIY